MTTYDTLAALVRDFDAPLAHKTGVSRADSELTRYGDGFKIVTLAEHTLRAVHATIVHRQTLAALHAQDGDSVAEWIKEHIVDAHYKTFGETLTDAVAAAELAWMRRTDPDGYAAVPDAYKDFHKEARDG